MTALDRPLILTAAFALFACGDDSAAGAAAAGGSGAGTAAAGNGSGAGSSGGAAAGGAATGGGGAGGAGPTIPFVYVGNGDGDIEAFALDRATGSLAALGAIAVGQNPSFLAASPDATHLYAVDEGADEVIAFAIDQASGELSEIGTRQSSEGSGPAYVSVDRSGAWVMVANYGGGTVAVLPVLADGSLGPAVDSESPGDNPHLIRADIANNHVYVPCLGSDIVAQFDFDVETGQLTANGNAPLPAGTGPRHLEFHPTLPVVYVIGELGDTLTTFAVDGNGALQDPVTISTLPNGADGSQNFCADLHIHPDGGYLFGSNRGDDSLARFTIDAATGAATAAGHTPTGGDWPRNFSIDPNGGILLVANQQSDEIRSFAIAPVTFTLTELVTTRTGPSPAFVGIVPQPAPR